MVIAVSVLGLVELHRDGERIAVRAGKSTEVLVRLALDAGLMVRTDRLIEDLWADEAIGMARNVLQTKVSRLRRALGDDGPRLIKTIPRRGYRFDASVTELAPRQCL